MDLRPFRGLRPRPDLAARIPSPPYDVPTDGEARALAAENPYTFLRVVRPEVDLDPAIDPHDPSVYARGRDNLRAMVDGGWLVRDAVPAFYVYRLTAGAHRQTGVLGLAAVDDYTRGVIRRHEHTRPEKELDRVRLNTALEANPGPVFLTYRDASRIDAWVERAANDPPRARFATGDGVEHALWVVDGPREVAEGREAFGEIERGYVADGHHRAAAAARVSAEWLARHPAASPEAPHRFFLAAYFPASQLQILGYHRVVRDLAGLSSEGLIQRLQDAGFRVAADPRSSIPERGTFGLYFGNGRWMGVEAPPGSFDSADPVDRLDAQVLSTALLQPILGIGDLRTDERVGFVGGSRGVAELERRVDHDGAALAIALHPTRVDDVLAVADTGGIMPPKSTWFEPKLRSGMVVQTLVGDAI